MLPKEPIDRVVTPVVQFMHIEAASGLVLLAASIAALGSPIHRPLRNSLPFGRHRSRSGSVGFDSSTRSCICSTMGSWPSFFLWLDWK